jgi:Nucleotidyl transferase AbiEii toxin, Type IV TA system
MNIQRVIAAALELQEQLDRIGLPFCFIGGLAVQRWGEPRLTVDADATVLTNFEHDESLVDRLLSHFRARRSDGREVALRNRVLLLSASDGTHIDVALGAIPFEARTIERSSPWHYRKDVTIRTCSADDLVVHKAFASRDRDWLDIDGILMRQGAKLDARLIFQELRPLVELKQDDSIIPRLEQKMRESGMEAQS